MDTTQLIGEAMSIARHFQQVDVAAKAVRRSLSELWAATRFSTYEFMTDEEREIHQQMEDIVRNISGRATEFQAMKYAKETTK